MTDTPKCDRCGQEDCPTLPLIALCWASRNVPGQNQVNRPEWTAAFQACATMMGANALHWLANNAEDDVVDRLRTALKKGE